MRTLTPEEAASPPDDFWAQSVCLIGKGSMACRYLTMSSKGWNCERGTSLGVILDGKVDTMSAKSINCAGRASR